MNTIPDNFDYFQIMCWHGKSFSTWELDIGVQEIFTTQSIE